MSRTSQAESATLLLLAGAVILAGYAFVVWLQTGVWRALTLLDIVCLSSDRRTSIWCLAPESWIGLHTLLGWASLWMVLLTLALVAGALD